MDNTVEILKKARRLIARGWVKGTFLERDAKGRLCYCASGAVRRAAGDGFDNDKGTYLACEVAPPADVWSLLNTVAGKNIVSFNDDDTTTKRDVLNVFDQAILLAEARA